MADAVRRGGAGLRRASAPALVALLATAAIAPVVAVGTPTGPVLMAGAGVLGSVGANVLTDVLAEVVARLRRDGKQPDREELQHALVTRIEQAFESQDEQSRQLRTELAALMVEVDAVGVALQTAVEVGDRALQDALAESFARLGGEFAEFGFVLADVRRSVWEIEHMMRGLQERGRAEQERSRDLALAVRRILDTVAAVEARTRAADGTGTDVEARWDGSPYLGLSPFEERHAEVFYGRRELITGLLQRLAEQLDLSAPLVMIGASGAGKSSLLRAGLLPQLAAGNLEPGSEGWPRRVFTPTATPLRELAVHLADLAGLDAASVHRSLVDDPGQAALIASQILRTNRATASSDERARARVVMVVDQFEELFTLARERPADQGAERRMFVAALRAMAGTPVGPADSPPGLILLAVRADFLDEIMSFPELRESVQRGPFVVGPMNEAELTAAIAGPAAEAGVTVDPALIDAVLHDLRGRASGSGFDIGVLPVLSQAMLTTWEHRGGDRLTVLEYRRAGGVADAVQTSAEEAYQRLDDQQQATARAVFTHLTVLTADGRLARRRMTLTSLREVCGQDGQVDLVVDVFTRKRLVMASDHGVEIGHDALLSNWSRLTGWLESDRTDRTLHNELTAEADAWHARDRDQSYLYRGEKLVAATSATRRWAADPARYPVLTATETAFLQQSTRAESRRRTTRLGVRSGLAVLLIISLGATVLAIQGQRDARQQQRVATAAALLGRADTVRGNAPQLALMLEIAAHRLHHNQTTTARMLTSLLSPYAGTLVGHQGTVSAVTFSPNGRTVASSGANNRVILWDTATARRVGELRGGARVDALAFSPDGQTLAAGDANGSVSLWRVSEPTQPRLTGTLRDQWTRLSSVVFSPDGRRLAGGDASGQTALWDVADPTRPRRLARLSGHTGWVTAAAFSPNGRTLVTGDSNGTAIIWDVPGARRLGQLVGHTQVVGAVAFSPDGRRVATGGGEAMVLLWDIGDPGRPKRLLSLTGHSRPVRAVQFSPQDGRVITTVAADHTVLQWDVTDLNRPVQSTIVLGGQSNWVNAVAVSPDGQYVATPSTDSTVILWRSGAGSGLGALVRLGGGNGAVGTVRFSGDGRLLAAGSADGTVDLWNMANRAHPLRLAHFGAHTGWVSSVAFSPDNQTLATSGADGNAILWDLTVAGAPRELTRMTDHHGVVTSVAFDRAHDDAVRRQTVATGGQDGTVALWDVTDLAAPRRLGTLRGHVAAVSAVAFSPSRGLLAVASVDGTATLWDVTYPERSDQLGLLTGHTNQVSTLSFGPDGNTLATGSHDTSVILWDIGDATRPRLIGTPRVEHNSWVRTVAFNGDGHYLVSGSDDGTIALWETTDVTQPQPLIRTRKLSAVVLSTAFSPDGRTLAAGVGDKSVYLWDLEQVIDAREHAVDRACQRAGRGLNRDEWAKFVPTLAYEQTCP